MNDKDFEQTYCSNCGTQRCEGIYSEWFEGCKYRWNHDTYDAASEIERLNKKIMDLARKLVERDTTVKIKTWTPIPPFEGYGELIKLYECPYCLMWVKGKPNVCPNCGKEVK